MVPLGKYFVLKKLTLTNILHHLKLHPAILGRRYNTMIHVNCCSFICYKFAVHSWYQTSDSTAVLQSHFISSVMNLMISTTTIQLWTHSKQACIFPFHSTQFKTRFAFKLWSWQLPLILIMMHILQTLSYFFGTFLLLPMCNWFADELVLTRM